jgi:transposase
MRALLVARKQLLGRLVDVELSIRGILRGFGLKVGQATRNEFEARNRELVIGQPRWSALLGQCFRRAGFEVGVREAAQGRARDCS